MIGWDRLRNKAKRPQCPNFSEYMTVLMGVCYCHFAAATHNVNLKRQVQLQPKAQGWCSDMVDFTTVLLKVRRKVMKWDNSVYKVPIKPNLTAAQASGTAMIG